MALLGRLNAGKKYMKLNKYELKNIIGGGSISATLLNYIIKGFNSILDIGRYLGSGIRRITSTNMCDMK